MIWQRLRTPSVPKQVLLFGLIGGALLLVLQAIEYRYLVLTHSVAIYGALIAALFAATGIWLGMTLTGRPERVVVREVPVPVPGVPDTAATPFTPDDARREALGITPRELEILGLIANGLSTREIAERTFVSENTVKTHASRLLTKLGARRRTHAVHAARAMGLIP